MKRRLRAAIATGAARGWKQPMRASDGRETEVGAAELLALLERYDGRNPRAVGSSGSGMFRPAAFQSDTGVISIAGMSTSPAHSSGFDFYTTSIAATTNVEKKWLENVWHRANRKVMLPNGAIIYNVTSEDDGNVNGAAPYDVYNTIWGGVSTGAGCAYDAAVSADHKLTGRRWASFHLLHQYIYATTTSIGSDQLRRPCHEKPVSHCDDPSTCNLDGDSGDDQPIRSVGGEVEWVVDPPQTSGGKLVCMVTDWYDEYGNYLDTSIDNCWIE